MNNNILIAIRLTVASAVLFSGVYSAAIWGIAHAAPSQGQGEIIKANGKNYYGNIAQNFDQNKYFMPRPSAAGYNAAGSCGSNKGPTNPEYLAEVRTRIDSLLAHNPQIQKSEIPADLVTASGSGLDPDISVRAAKMQIKRIAKARGLDEKTVLQLVESQIERPVWGIFGIEKINVLKLNLALETIK